MKEKMESHSSIPELNQDQEITESAESREDLIMALNSLLQALNTLRSSLLTLQTRISQMQKILPLIPAPAPVKATAVTPLELLKKPRYLN